MTIKAKDQKKPDFWILEDRVKKKEIIVFYLYSYSDNNQSFSNKTIYSPFNTRENIQIDGKIVNDFVNPDFVTFADWFYVADPKVLGEKRYLQHVEFLLWYNREWKDLSNGVFIKTDGIHFVVTEHLSIEAPETKVVEKVLKIIPLVLLQHTPTTELLKLIEDRWIKIPEWLKEETDINKQREEINKILVDSGIAE